MDLRHLEVVMLPERMILNIVVEGNPPTCFECGLKRHIKKRAPTRNTTTTTKAKITAKKEKTRNLGLKKEERDREKWQ